MSGTSEMPEEFTIAPGSKSTSGGSTALGTALGGRAGIEMGALKHLLTDLEEVTSGFY